MSSAAILGAGPIGSAIAHRLAERARIGEIRLIDEAGAIAAGKALDIRQAGPVDGYDTSISGTTDVLSAAGADVIVFADPVADGEWEGERGLALVQRLVRAGTSATFVFAGPKQASLMEAAAREGRVPNDRLIGTAAATLPHTVSALLHVETGLNGAVVSVAGRPPSFVVAWSIATIGGRLVTEVVPAHRLHSISESLGKLWPPGPQAIAAPTAAVVEGLIAGARFPVTASVITDGEFGARGVSALMPIELGNKRILKRALPTQSPQERTETTSILSRRA
jgi:malate/lactate dehydrogenase